MFNTAVYPSVVLAVTTRMCSNASLFDPIIVIFFNPRMCSDTHLFVPITRVWCLSSALHQNKWIHKAQGFMCSVNLICNWLIRWTLLFHIKLEHAFVVILKFTLLRLCRDFKTVLMFCLWPSVMIILVSVWMFFLNLSIFRITNKFRWNCTQFKCHYHWLI